MSEYQYYEFQAIDRPLTEKEMAQLRSYSTRARITPRSFVNDYSWGDFKGDADAWMEKYFDVFLYLANWGTHSARSRVLSSFFASTRISFRWPPRPARPWQTANRNPPKPDGGWLGCPLPRRTTSWHV
jgi:hypothetical protein